MTHQGRRTYAYAGDWLPMLSPSSIAEPHHRGVPKAMEDQDIARVIEDFTAAARRCEEGGFDGIELQAFGHLIGQFLTPLVNIRKDEYGGALQNRLRFLLDITAAIRRVVSQDFIIGVRMTGDERSRSGLTPNDCISMVQTLESIGDVDIVNVNGGHPFTELGLAEWVPNMGLPSAQFLEVAAAIKRETKLPILHAGGIGDLATARYAIKEGLVDLVGLTRANLVDPYLVEKLIARQEERIRPCVGLGYCIDRVFGGLDVVCAHNTATGRETFIPHKIHSTRGPPRRVTVVGGGPAGLEAARVAATRRHKVMLLEANSELGGQLILAARPLGRRQLLGIADWLSSEVGRLQVDVRLNVLADKNRILESEPDDIIIATGGLPSADNFLGAEHIVTVWDCLAGVSRASGDVMLWDGAGDHQAASCAQFLAEQGARVTFVTPDRAPMLELGATTAPVYQREFYKLGVVVLTDHRLIEVSLAHNRRLVRLENTLTGVEKMMEFDQVVVEQGTLPVDDLYFELRPLSANLGEIDLRRFAVGDACAVNRNSSGKFNLFRIGDAVTSRNIHAAMFDGTRIGLGL
jgi:2,4-dienoyl-CoA reductase-like NADH-dependent reductase (Old Yellow Enzyme family)/thioredoxin reductase